MIDIFAILLTHGLIALAAMRLLMREDLDDGSVGEADGVKEPRTPERPWLKNQTRHQADHKAQSNDA